MTTNTGPAILGRLLGFEPTGLNAEAARSILNLDFSTEDHQRVAELSAKASEGNMSADEREELDEYLRVADLLAILQSKARLSLKRSGASA